MDALLQVGSILVGWFYFLLHLEINQPTNQPTTLVLENRFRWTTAGFGDDDFLTQTLSLFSPRRFVGMFGRRAWRISDNLNFIVTKLMGWEDGQQTLHETNKMSHVCLFQVTQGAPIALKWYEWTSNAISFLNVSRSKQLELAGKLVSFRFSEIMGV